jgi:hypothetical protein
MRKVGKKYGNGHGPNYRNAFDFPEHLVVRENGGEILNQRLA